jgi:hypothetical protein
MKKVVFEEKKMKLRNKLHVVENKTEIVQRVFQMQ